MNADQLIDSKMMVSAEFGTRGIPKEPTVTIASVTREAQDKDGKEVWAILTFTEPFAKPLKMNRHSQKCCIAMFGKETDHWIGKRLSLFAKDGYYFGERGTAVRIKGSPDLAAPISVEVKKRSSKKPDVYNLVPTGPQQARPAASSAPAAAQPPKSEAPKAATPAAPPPEPEPSARPPDPAPPPKTPPPPPNDQPVADPKFLGPVFAFGPHKGKSIEHASKPDILGTIALGETQLLENKELTAGQQKSVQAGIDACRRELERRFKVGNATPPPPEPGSDG